MALVKKERPRLVDFIIKRIERRSWGKDFENWFDNNYDEPVEVEFENRPTISLEDGLEKLEEVLPERSIAIYNLYREKVTHEDTLVNWRTTWFVAFQAFLFTGFALSQGRFEALQWLINLGFALTGIAIAIASFISIVAAKEAVNHTVRKWRTEYKDPSGRHLARGVRDLIDPAGILPAIKGAGSQGNVGLRGNVLSFFAPIFLSGLWVVIILFTAITVWI